MLWWSLSVFRLCFTCWVYSSLDLGCRLGPGWASSHLMWTLLAFWRSCLWPFYREREWHSALIRRSRQLTARLDIQVESMLHSSTIYSICTFGTLLYFHFAGHEPKIMYYVSPDSVVLMYSSIVLLIPMLGRCIQDMYYFLSMYFIFCWQYLYIQTSSCHLPYCVPFWVRLPLYFILWDYSVYCLIVTTEQLSEPMTNGWYMASLTLFDLYPDCSWHINLRGVTVGIRALGFFFFWGSSCVGYGASLGVLCFIESR